jgi:hypothetical protein
VTLAGLITHTHTCRSCRNSHLCIILTPSHFPTPTHQTRSSQIPVSYYTRQCITIYIGLCNGILSKLKTDNILLLNITRIFWRDNVFGFNWIRGVWLWKGDVTERGREGSDADVTTSYIDGARSHDPLLQKLTLMKWSIVTWNTQKK